MTDITVDYLATTPASKERLAMATTINEADVTLGNGVVTVRRKGSSSLVIANVLGTVATETSEAIYLDRLVHKPFEQSLGNFAVTGAISSVLHHSKAR